MTTVEDRRRFYAASLLLGLALSAVANGDDSPDTAEERERARTRRGGLLDEGSRLLDAIGDHPDLLRLRGIYRDASGDTHGAVKLFREAVAAGDSSALIRLRRLLDDSGADPREVTLIGEEIKRLAAHGDPAVLWSMVRDHEAAPDLHEDLLAASAAGGHVLAQGEYARLRMARGEPAGLDALRSAADQHENWEFYLGQHLAIFDGSTYVTAREESDEQQPAEVPEDGRDLILRAHEKGSIEASFWLWARSDAPANDAFLDCLLDLGLREDTIATMATTTVAASGGWVVGQAVQTATAGENLEALRLFALGVTFGEPAATADLGALLHTGADGEGPWAILGHFLNEWPARFRADLVGALDVPLVARRYPPALRLDYHEDIEIAHSAFAGRLGEAFTASGSRLWPIGDHVLAGNWLSIASPVVHLIEIPRGADGSESCARISTPVMARIPDGVPVPWITSDDDINGGCASPRMEVNRLEETFHTPQRRILEALFRMGENDSAETVLTGLGSLGISLGGMLGRAATFQSTPPDLYPEAWVSRGLSDYVLVNEDDTTPGGLLQLDSPVEVIYCGYTLSADLTGDQLKDAVAGVVDSLTRIQGFTGDLFDTSPGLFGEFFAFIPMPQLWKHLDVFESRFPHPHQSEGTSDLFDRGNSAHAAGDTHAAKKYWEEAAELGDTKAMCQLGSVAMDEGDTERGIALWLQAAGMGDTSAMVVIGILQAQGGDGHEAQRWWSRAAAEGDTDGMTNLAALARDSGDVDGAKEWWERAARAGDGSAMCELGFVAHSAGNLDLARTWWERGAEAMNGVSMFALGVLASDEERTADAKDWWQRAAALGNAAAMSNLGALAHAVGSVRTRV